MRERERERERERQRERERDLVPIEVFTCLHRGESADPNSDVLRAGRVAKNF